MKRNGPDQLSQHTTGLERLSRSSLEATDTADLECDLASSRTSRYQLDCHLVFAS
jgi:hypothetical protein